MKITPDQAVQNARADLPVYRKKQTTWLGILVLVGAFILAYSISSISLPIAIQLAVIGGWLFSVYKTVYYTQMLQASKLVLATNGSLNK